MSTNERGRRGVGLFGAAISLVAVAAVVIWALSQPPPQLPSGTGLLLFGGAIALYAVDMVVRGERWRALLLASGPAPSHGDCIGLSVVGTAGNNVLPARGGDGLRAYYCSKLSGATFREAIGSLVAERLLDVGVLVGLYAIVSYGLLAGIEVPEAETQLIITAVAVGALAVVGAAWVLRRSERARRLARAAAPMVRATRALRGTHGVRMSAVSILIWLGDAIVFLLCAQAVGFEITVFEALYLLGLAGVFVLIPSGPGFAGTFYAAVLFGAAALGASNQLALSFLITLRLAVFVPITVVGLGAFLLRYMRLGDPRRVAKVTA
ncbi:MAG: lysylphosphatidylglycerol synthase transmembrane domain-containing protein [Solirubrobacterales bacterium]